MELWVGVVHAPVHLDVPEPREHGGERVGDDPEDLERRDVLILVVEDVARVLFWMCVCEAGDDGMGPYDKARRGKAAVHVSVYPTRTNADVPPG